MELRAAAYISGDPVMTEVFEEGLSLHKITAARMLNITPDQVSKSEKQGAKAVNFGAIYGIGAAKLAESAWKNYAKMSHAQLRRREHDEEEELREWLDAQRRRAEPVRLSASKRA